MPKKDEAFPKADAPVATGRRTNRQKLMSAVKALNTSFASLNAPLLEVDDKWSDTELEAEIRRRAETVEQLNPNQPLRVETK